MKAEWNLSINLILVFTAVRLTHICGRMCRMSETYLGTAYRAKAINGTVYG